MSPVTCAVFYWLEASHKPCLRSRRGDATKAPTRSWQSWHRQARTGSDQTVPVAVREIPIKGAMSLWEGWKQGRRTLEP